MGFPDGSAGKESACNAEDPTSIPQSGRSPGEWIGYPLQYFWASIVTQLVKNPVQCGRSGFNPWVENSPGEGKSYPLQYSSLENSMGYVYGVVKSPRGLSDFHFQVGRKWSFRGEISAFKFSRGSRTQKRLRIIYFKISGILWWPSG